jgi:hypothetical protein
MPRQDQKTITMSGETLRKLEREYKTEKGKQPGLSFSGFISENAIMELERKKILREAQFISVIGFQDNLLYLKDVREDQKFVEVQILEKKLKCLTENSYNCIHVGFALALPEVRKVLKS